MKIQNSLTEKQLDLLRHMLGINDPGKDKPEPWRNYAAVNPGDLEFVELEKLGMVEVYRDHGKNNGYDYYRCTESGRLAAIQSFRSIQYSRSRRRYLKFLDLCDCIPDLTFHDYITRPEFKAYRMGQ